MRKTLIVASLIALFTADITSNCKMWQNPDVADVVVESCIVESYRRVQTLISARWFTEALD